MINQARGLAEHAEDSSAVMVVAILLPDGSPHLFSNAPGRKVAVPLPPNQRGFVTVDIPAITALVMLIHQLIPKENPGDPEDE